MTPFFFGRSRQSLYGVYHAPLGRARRQAVLLCYPAGFEYFRAHKAFHLLAGQLAAEGTHVLRFDYRGTGDSFGEMDTVVASDWLLDVAQAIDELKALAGVDRVSIVGLRLGALFAARACEGRSDVSGLVLWDAVPSGAGLVEQLGAAVERERHPPVDAKVGRWPEPGNRRLDDGSFQVNGFEYPARFLASLSTWELASSQPPATSRILQILTQDRGAVASLEQAWQHHPDLVCLKMPGPHDWGEADNEGGVLLPHAVIKAIREWLH